MDDIGYGIPVWERLEGGLVPSHIYNLLIFYLVMMLRMKSLGSYRVLISRGHYNCWITGPAQPHWLGSLARRLAGEP